MCITHPNLGILSKITDSIWVRLSFDSNTKMLVRPEDQDNEGGDRFTMEITKLKNALK